MVPSGVKFHDTKPNIGKDSLDDYITRMICYGFNLTPSALVADNNRATSETLSTLAKEDGLAPLLDWVKNLIDSIIVKQFGYDDVEFLWNIEEEQDPLTSSQIDVSLVNAGILTINEVRSSRGLDPLDEPKPDSANDNTNKVYFEKKAFNDGY